MPKSAFSVDDLVVEIEQTGNVKRVEWRGRSTPRKMPEDLVSFVDQIFEGDNPEICVEFHLEELSHANSQTVGFITTVVGRSFGNLGKTTFFFDPKRNFQQVLFAALQPMLVTHSNVSFRAARFGSGS